MKLKDYQITNLVFNQNKITKIYWYLYFFILILAAAVRIWVIYYSGKPWFSFDSYEYFKMADAILKGTPLSSYPNGYPLLIVLLKIILPEQFVPNALVTLNLGFQLLTIVFLERILVNYNFQKSLILLTLLILAIYPNQINYSRQILTEPISTFLIIIIIYFYSIKSYFFSGFLGYFVSTFRPTMLPLIPVLIIFILFRKERAIALKIGGGFLVCLFLFIALEQFGLIKPADNLTINLLLSTKRTMGVPDNYVPADFTQEEIHHPLKTYINYAVENPLDFIKKRALSFWYLWGLGVDTRQGIWYLDLLLKIRFPLFIISFLTFLYRKKFPEFKDLIEISFVPVIILTVIHTFFFSGHRFTLIVDPLIIFLSILGIFKFYKIKYLQIKARGFPNN